MTISTRRQIGPLLMLMYITLSQAHATDNYLIGSWGSDINKTLRNLRPPPENASEGVKSSAAKAQKFIEAPVRTLGTTTLTYSADEYTEVIKDRNENVLSSKSAPYKVIEVGKQYMVVDQLENGGPEKLFFEKNAFYVEVRIGEYTYRDYFTKLLTGNLK